MSVFFLRKKAVLCVVFILSFVVTASSLFYALIIGRAQVYKHNQTFYFLVSQNPHIEASSLTIKAENGAGYLLEKDGNNYVALSVYLSETDAKKALESAKHRFTEITYIPVTSENLYFITRGEKINAQETVNGLKTLLTGIVLLDKEIYRLEKGATQQSTKRVIKDLSKTIVFLGKENELFQVLGKNTTSIVGESLENIVYLKDLRYLLCFLCDEYTRICAKFSL